MTSLEVPLVIDKEAIGSLHFPESEVLASIDEIQNRNYELKRAAQLGNGDHVKMKIIFEDAEGLKKTETTIWAVTDKSVILKHGATIPIKRIREIKI